MLNKYLQNTVSQSVRNPGNQIVGNSPKFGGGGEGGLLESRPFNTFQGFSLYNSSLIYSPTFHGSSYPQSTVFENIIWKIPEVSKS